MLDALESYVEQGAFNPLGIHRQIKSCSGYGRERIC